jgi:hypothetical protein
LIADYLIANLYERNSFVAHFDIRSQWATNTVTKKGYRCYDNPHFQYFTLFLGWKMGLERRSRSEDTSENKYLFYPRNPQQHSLLQTKAERRRRVFGGGAFGCSQTGSAYNKKTQGKNLASAF